MTETDPLLCRIAAEDAIRFTTPIYINETIGATFYQVTGELTIPEDRGILLFLPLGEGAYNIKVLLPELDRNGANVLLLSYLPEFLSQWPVEMFLREHAFCSDEPVEYFFELTTPVAEAMEELSQDTLLPDLQYTLKQTETAVALLRRITDQINIPFTACPVPACRFLAYDAEREKIFKARDILLAEFDQAVSVKSLARRVAMNECYLKKGFKTLTGKSIHEFILWQRTEKARSLLAEGSSVTEVAAVLGYSSISHFSTAFKKATGLKPCQLIS